MTVIEQQYNLKKNREKGGLEAFQQPNNLNRNDGSILLSIYCMTGPALYISFTYRLTKITKIITL